MGPRELTLLSVNLWNGRASAEALERVLCEHRPDVVVAQELSDCAADVLERHFDASWLRPRSDTFGMGTAIRGEAAFRELPMPRRNFIAAQLRPVGWPHVGPPLEIINVHLSCPDRPGRIPERAVQIRRLHALQRAAPSPRVLAGDFNTAIPMPAYFALRARWVDAAWQVALRKRDLRALPRPTWGPTAGAARIARIDHVFLEGVEATEMRTIPVRGSDHDGVLVSLRPAS